MRRLDLEGPVALFGGVYNNHLALEAAIDDAKRRGARKLMCLGDLGAFGPSPAKIFPLLETNGVVTMQGNYDHSIGHELADCQCGYTDPADNHFARLSYEYTFQNTPVEHRPWLRDLPTQLRFDLGGRRVLCVHGSPRQMNEFLWESTTPTHLLEQWCDEHACDMLVCTHTGIPWTRQLSGDRLAINIGCLGRPANDGTPQVGYHLLDANGGQYVRIDYDHEALAAEMRDEGIADPFIETIRTGWWTTCLEILPAKERAAGKW
ncbi:MAG: metallophosphoesterase family protein [Planctomycetota bacterium]